MLRQTILWLARSERIKKLISTMPVSSGIVSSYVPGEDTASAVRATEELIASGLHVTLDHLGEEHTTTQSILSNLGQSYKDADRIDDAIIREMIASR